MRHTKGQFICHHILSSNLWSVNFTTHSNTVEHGDMQIIYYVSQSKGPQPPGAAEGWTTTILRTSALLQKDVSQIQPMTFKYDIRTLEWTTNTQPRTTIIKGGATVVSNFNVTPRGSQMQMEEWRAALVNFTCSDNQNRCYKAHDLNQELNTGNPQFKVSLGMN